MADHHGSAGAVAEAVREARDQLPADRGQQLDLLAEAQRPIGERLWTREAVAEEVERVRKAGRPKGAQNLATRELREWIVHLLGGTPQERMARWAQMEPEEMARRLGCSVLDAWDRQKELWKELSPYIMARMQPVDDQGRAVPLVALSIGGQVGQANGAAPWATWFEGRPEPVDVTPQEDGE